MHLGNKRKFPGSYGSLVKLEDRTSSNGGIAAIFDIKGQLDFLRHIPRHSFESMGYNHSSYINLYLLRN